MDGRSFKNELIPRKKNIDSTMSNILADSKKYFYARMQEYSQRPDLHTWQMPVVREYLEILQRVQTPEEYTQQLGDKADMFALARAEQMDRYYNLTRLYESLGDADKADAARLRFEKAKNASSHAGLVGGMHPHLNPFPPRRFSDCPKTPRSGLQAPGCNSILILKKWMRASPRKVSPRSRIPM